MAETTIRERKQTAERRLPVLSTFLFLCAFSAFPLVKTTDAAPSSNTGTGDSKSAMLTPLQMHASFFDRDKDGLVYLKETYDGLRAIGLGVVRATSLALVINGGLSLATSPNKIPSPRLPIYVENISRGKHGSDSGAYDSEGRFVPEKFEEIFKKYAKVNPNALTSEEVDEMLKGNEQPNDRIGHAGSMLEWRLLYDLAKDKEGFLHKDITRSVFDGSLFYRLERERSSILTKQLVRN